MSHVVFFRKLSDELPRMVEVDKDFFKFFCMSFLHDFVLCLNDTIHTLSFEDNITILTFKFVIKYGIIKLYNMYMEIP